MLRFPTLLAYGLLSLGNPQAQAPLTPEEMLSRAVSKVSLCHSTSEIIDLEKNRLVKPTKDDAGTVKKITPEVLFRNGRYKLRVEEGSFVVEGRTAYKLHFSPWPGNEQLRSQSGDDEKVDRALNHLTGWVVIDHATGGIISVEASLTDTLRYKAGLGAIYNLSFTVKQKLESGRWLLSRAVLTIHYRKLFRATRNQYTTSFHCK